MKLSKICRVLLCIGVALMVLGLTTIVITSNAILAFDAPTPEAYQFLLIEQIGTEVAFFGAVTLVWAFVLELIRR